MSTPRYHPGDLREFYELVGAHCEDMLSAEQAARLQSMLLQDSELRSRFVLCIHIQAVTERRLAAFLPGSGEAEPASSPIILRRQASNFQSRRSPLFGFLGNLSLFGGELAGASFFQWAVLGMIGTGVATMLVMVALLTVGGIRDWGLGIRDQNAASHPILLGEGQGEGQGEGTSNRSSASNPDANASGSRPQFAARLTRVAGVHWLGNKDTPKKGDDLFEGRQLQLDSGVAEFIFQGGAKVLVQGPAEVEFLSATSARLIYGSLTVRVENPLARGFEVHTPGMKYTDLGTEFGVSVARDGMQEMHVFRGRVSAEAEAASPEANASGSPLVITADQALKIPAPGKPIERIAADERQFVRSGQMNAMVDQQSTGFDHWKDASEKLSKQGFREPGDLVAYYDFQPDQSDLKALRNRARTGRPFDGKLVGGAKWVAGRLPGKQALEFVTLGSGVRVDIPLEFKQITLVAWARIDPVQYPRTRAFLNSDDWEERPGSVHWQMSANGVFRLDVSYEAQKTNLFAAQDTFRPEAALGHWAMYAESYDSNTSQDYGYYNGDLVLKQTACKPVPAMIGRAMIGRFSPRPHDEEGNPERTLGGRIDELMIFNTALSAEDIMYIYRGLEAGKK